MARGSARKVPPGHRYHVVSMVCGRSGRLPIKDASTSRGVSVALPPDLFPHGIELEDCRHPGLER